MSRGLVPWGDMRNPDYDASDLLERIVKGASDQELLPDAVFNELRLAPPKSRVGEVLAASTMTAVILIGASAIRPSGGYAAQRPESGIIDEVVRSALPSGGQATNPDGSNPGSTSTAYLEGDSLMVGDLAVGLKNMLGAGGVSVVKSDVQTGKRMMWGACEADEASALCRTNPDGLAKRHVYCQMSLGVFSWFRGRFRALLLTNSLFGGCVLTPCGS